MHVYWKVYLRFYETLMCTCPCDKDPLLVYPGSKIWWKHLKWTDLGLPKLISFFLFESGLHLTTLIAFQILFLLKFTIQRNIRSAHWKKKCFFSLLCPATIFANFASLWIWFWRNSTVWWCLPKFFFTSPRYF